jgi:hypothetical protein
MLVFGINKELDWRKLVLPDWCHKHKIKMRSTTYAIIFMKGFNRIEWRYLEIIDGYIYPTKFSAAVNFKLNFTQPNRKIL